MPASTQARKPDSLLSRAVHGTAPTWRNSGLPSKGEAAHAALLAAARTVRPLLIVAQELEPPGEYRDALDALLGATA